MTIQTQPTGNWRAAGACLHADPDLFFPISDQGRAAVQIAKAKAICASCPVRRPCLDFAMANEPAYGIWGGATLKERERVRQRERRAARSRSRAGAEPLSGGRRG